MRISVASKAVAVSLLLGTLVSKKKSLDPVLGKAKYNDCNVHAACPSCPHEVGFHDFENMWRLTFPVLQVLARSRAQTDIYRYFSGHQIREKHETHHR